MSYFIHKHKTTHTELLFGSTSVKLLPSTIKGIYIHAELQILKDVAML